MWLCSCACKKVFETKRVKFSLSYYILNTHIKIKVESYFRISIVSYCKHVLKDAQSYFFPHFNTCVFYVEDALTDIVTVKQPVKLNYDPLSSLPVKLIHSRSHMAATDLI